MKFFLIVLIGISITAFAFDLGSFTKGLKSQIPETKTQTTTELSNSTITSGLKDALKIGINFAVKQLGKNNGYLNNYLVKIPLPENLAKAESIIRSAGGGKMADDLITSMNTAATNAAPKTAEIFIAAIDKMSLDDAKTILAGNNDAATEYFKTNTSASLKKVITPIIQETMKENKVATYYDALNSFYKSNAKGLVESSGAMNLAKSFGADTYLPSSSEQNLDDYVTNRAMDGLFKMIAQKESEIRTNPVAQTTSLLKQVFGK